MKLFVTLLAPLLLAACAETPNPTVTRHQIDDLADSDQDGVINQRDLCFDTPENVSVDVEGCADWKVVEKIQVISVAFEFDKYEIKPEHDAPLTELVTLLVRHPDASVTLVGDTSSEGTNQYNKVLAQKRTGVIKAELVGRGIAAARIAEQEFTQITNLTQHLHARKRRTIAVVTFDDMEVNQAWDIFTSERNLSSSTSVEEVQ
ncbi:OmpA family protein [Vibrio makurazakiensis]|uniref:OmpA family protein n=1 Tax=Vibrio makurazakiensis TaxID=2910250 RepID=UPI003D1126EC